MITSTANPRVKAARKLLERKERHRARLLLVEGVRLIGDAWAQGVRPALVFYDPDLLGRRWRRPDVVGYPAGRRL